MYQDLADLDPNADAYAIGYAVAQDDIRLSKPLTLTTTLRGILDNHADGWCRRDRTWLAGRVDALEVHEREQSGPTVADLDAQGFYQNPDDGHEAMRAAMVPPACQGHPLPEGGMIYCTPEEMVSGYVDEHGEPYDGPAHCPACLSHSDLDAMIRQDDCDEIIERAIADGRVTYDPPKPDASRRVGTWRYNGQAYVINSRFFNLDTLCRHLRAADQDILGHEEARPATLAAVKHAAGERVEPEDFFAAPPVAGGEHDDTCPDCEGSGHSYRYHVHGVGQPGTCERCGGTGRGAGGERGDEPIRVEVRQAKGHVRDVYIGDRYIGQVWRFTNGQWDNGRQEPLHDTPESAARSIVLAALLFDLSQRLTVDVL